MYKGRSCPAFVLIGIAGCGGLSADTNAELDTVLDNVVFGSDSRLEYGAISDTRLLRVADASGAIFDPSDVACNGGTCLLTTQPFDEGYTDRGYKDLCDDVAFKGQPQGALCTAFLVGPDLMATAGHCLDCDSSGCPPCSADVIFGFAADANGAASTQIADDDKYTCVGTPTGIWDLATGEDWAVFQLDRSVEDRTPLVVNYSGKVSDTGEELATAGHPDGIPLKAARNGFVKEDSASLWFGTNLDVFAGSSGSAIIDYRSGVVEGIHVRRPYSHYLAVSDGFLSKCATENVCSVSSGCSPNFGESAFAIATRFRLAAGVVPLHAAVVSASVL